LPHPPSVSLASHRRARFDRHAAQGVNVNGLTELLAPPSVVTLTSHGPEAVPMFGIENVIEVSLHAFGVIGKPPK
jgi:hypothetical protein